MATGATQPAATRDRECFFRAAYDLLGEGGYGTLTVAALCERVGVTKGSFYHHFEDLPAFVAAFAERWLAWLTSLVDSYLAEPDLLRRLGLIINSHIVTMVGAESAIRAWSWVDPTIAEAMRTLDALGMRLGADTYGRLAGNDPDTGLMLSYLAFGILIGMQLRPEPVHPDRFVEIAADWHRRCLHIEVEPVRSNDRAYIRVVARRDEAVPPVRPVQWVTAPVDSLGEASAIAVAQAAAELQASAERGKLAWYQAAREIATEQGSDAVTVAAMCGRLGVTKGSFHHHFATMAAFVAWVAEYWEANFRALQEVAEREPDPIRRLEIMFFSSFSLDPRMESAWMAWGWSTPPINDALRRVERAAELTLTHTLAEITGDTASAPLLGEFSAGLSIGLIAWRPTLDAETRGVIGVEWLRRCVGLDADLCMVDGVPRVVNIRRPAG
jgi:AcrR family transcriptional regulator